VDEASRALAFLRTPAAVRARANALFELAERGELEHLALDLSRLDAAADFVAEVIVDNYPSLEIPYHARWRHFSAGGVDRWAALQARLSDCDAKEIARTRIDLCVPSVLLDAGAGPEWRYREAATGETFARSEGLGVASFRAFGAGLFSGNAENPLRADAAGLAALTEAALASSFQVGPGNPLLGLDARALLMQRLGIALRARPDLFGADARIGNLFDAVLERAEGGSIEAAAILAVIIEGFADVWPGRDMLGGANLGDVWRHRALPAETTGGQLVPFHKLSQWLTYSLAEVFEDAGVPVAGIEALTGLPEYRNGGLFLDLGVLALRDPALAQTELPVGHEAVVEWRALTVALLDRIADPIRARLGRTAEEMPLARILEGGTWAAGRRTAQKLRGGAPPLRIISDGTVF
jgi:hypothetical protein